MNQGNGGGRVRISRLSSFILRSLEERTGETNCCIKCAMGDLLGDPVVKNPPSNAGNMGSIPGPGRFHMLWGN